MKKKIISAILATAVLATSACLVTASAADTKTSSTTHSVENINNDFYKISCFDINKDGYTDVYDLVLMRQFLLQTNDLTIPEYEKENSEITTEMMNIITDWMTTNAPESYAGITDIKLHVIETNTGRISDSAIATLTFDKTFDEDILYILPINSSEKAESTLSYIKQNKINKLRILIKNGNVHSAALLKNDTLTSNMTELNNMTDKQKTVMNTALEFMTNTVPMACAQITDVNINDTGNSNISIVTITLDQTLDNDTIYQLCHPATEEELEEKISYVNKNNVHQIRLTVKNENVYSANIYNGNADIKTNITTFDHTEKENEIINTAIEFMANNAPTACAKISDIEISKFTTTSNTNLVTLTLDQTLDKDTIYQLCRPATEEELEEQMTYIKENNIHKLRMTIRDGNVYGVATYNG